MSDPTEEPSLLARVSLRGWILLAGAVALAFLLATWRRSPPAAPPAVARAAPVLPTRLPPEELSPAEAEKPADPVSGYRREVVRPKPVQSLVGTADPGEDTPPAAAAGNPASRKRDEKKSLPEIFRMPGETPLPAPAAPRAAPAAVAAAAGRADPDDFAPFGRLIKCQLVQTIDSVTARTEPIVALVTADLDWNGTTIIPAGSEAFSYAVPQPVIDVGGVGRLVDNGEWTLVLPAGPGGANGRELVVRGRAVDRRESVVSAHGDARAWGSDDGTDGLVGFTLSTLDNREVKLFAAAAIAGLAQGLGAIAERQEPAPGLSGALGATQAAPTVGNAVVAAFGTGAVDAVNEVAARIRDEIAKRGVYVRVPAGKTFYLFVEQTIDPRSAEIGRRLPAAGRLAP
jgi:hypothetical protein